MLLQSLFTIFPLYLLYGSTVASAQGTHNALLNDEMNAFINQALRDFNSPGGAAVAVVRMDDNGVWNVETKGYGVATANGSKVTENTLFAVGSTSKVGLFSLRTIVETRMTVVILCSFSLCSLQDC
jgi:CubicO group peptidase (beta-lactamase class C family)